MGYFILSSDRAGLRLKSFGATSRGEKSTLRIELETTDPYELGYALTSLAEVQKGQRAPQRPPSPKKNVATRLALPAPLISLPSPDEGENS